MTRWQRSVTLKAIRENQVQGFDTLFIAKPEDMAGTLTPFRPVWDAQYLGDGTSEIFDDIKECQAWVRQWDDI